MSIHSISHTIDRALTAAGLTTKTGPLKGVTETIEKALAAAGLSRLRVASPRPASPLFRTPRPMAPDGSTNQRTSPVAGVGQFLTLSHGSGAASRAYKLYVPSGHGGEPLPLIVMLHGCKQNPDDFAAGTRMNELAERDGFLVAYPSQTARENGANCWNWFDPSEQSRDGVEPSLIAGIVGEIRRSYEVDESRVFVAGLSAGAAMAVILGATHPEIFAGVAAHSGLPSGAAHDVQSAFSAMQGRAAPPRRDMRRPAVPTIVIHGDTDATVSSSNGDAIVEQAVLAHAQSNQALLKRTRLGSSVAGKTVTTTDFVDGDGNPRVEAWAVHGGAHAWFGGNPEGSYTDPTGPDASEEIVRFFLSLKA